MRARSTCRTSALDAASHNSTSPGSTTRFPASPVIQKFEQAAEEKLHEIKDELQELIPHPLARSKETPKQKSKAEGD